jgi:hypothetical protein
VAIIAASLPPGSAVEVALMSCFLPFIEMRGTLGNEQKARARDAVLGALSRGVHVRLADGSAGEVDIDSKKLLRQLLEECGMPP